MAQRVGVLGRTPAHNGFGVREFVRVNVEHRAIGGHQLRIVLAGLGVNLFNELQPFIPRLGQSDYLFEPVGASRFDVQTGVMFFDQPVDNGVDRKLVAAGMNTELEGIGQSEFLYGEGNDAQVLVELLLELRQIPYVIDAFVEPSSELWGDRLDRYMFLGDHRQDQEQLHRALGGVGLVYGDFGDKALAPFLFLDVPINPTRLLHGEQEFAGGSAYGFFGEVERPFDSRNGERAAVAAHGLQEDADCVSLGRFAGEIRYVQGKKVASRNKRVDRFQADVVGIDVVSSREA